MKHKITEIWEKVQSEKPLVHCITNIVTVNDCANILLAAGASPTMAHHEFEVEEVISGCKSLVCNMGAMECLKAMNIAGNKAESLGKPIVVDPVGAAGAAFRRNSTLELIEQIHPTCIRGNYSEIKALRFNKSLGAGVDAQEADVKADKDDLSVAQAAMDLARKLSAIDYQTHYVIASGVVDYVTDGNTCYEVKNGSALMSKVTGMGCMASSLLGAFLGVENSLESALAACLVMGICGEIAQEKTIMADGGSATFHIQFIDAVSTLTAEEIQKRIRYDIL